MPRAVLARSDPLTPVLRRGLLTVAALVCLLTFLPPLSSLARHYEAGDVVRYGLWAIAVPPLVALGMRWPQAETLAQARVRHPELGRVVAFLLLDWLVMVWWFTPFAVRATRSDPWLSAVEALTLIAAGIGFWLELVESPPLVPRLGAFRRAVLGALAMWLIWIEAYLIGMAQSGWYRDFTHVPGRGLSQAADQQVAAVALWFIATVVFVPVIFMNALRWLHSDAEPDAELRKLVKEDRRGVGAFMEHRGAVTPGEGAGQVGSSS
jgi:cytochrome c oxidase assembly factor CtaG